MALREEIRSRLERRSETQHQLARDHRILTEDWVGYAIAVCTVLLFMILVGVLPVGQ